MVFSFRKSKKGKDSHTIEINHNQYLANSIDSRKIAIYAIPIMSLMDIKKTMDFLDEGNPVLVSLRQIRKKDTEKADEFLRRLIEYTRSIRANLLWIGDSYLIISPSEILIKKMPPSNLETNASSPEPSS